MMRCCENYRRTTSVFGEHCLGVPVLCGSTGNLIYDEVRDIAEDPINKESGRPS